MKVKLLRFARVFFCIRHITLLINFPFNSLKGWSTAFLNHFEYIEGQIKKKKDDPCGVRYSKAAADIIVLSSDAMNRELSFFVDVPIVCDLAEQLKPEWEIILNWIKKQLHLDYCQMSDEGTNNVLRKIDDIKKKLKMNSHKIEIKNQNKIDVPCAFPSIFRD